MSNKLFVYISVIVHSLTAFPSFCEEEKIDSELLLRVQGNPLFLVVSGRIKGHVEQLPIPSFDHTGDLKLATFNYCRLEIESVLQTVPGFARFHAALGATGPVSNGVLVNLIWLPGILEFDDQVNEHEYFILLYNPAITAFQIEPMSQAGFVKAEEVAAEIINESKDSGDR